MKNLPKKIYVQLDNQGTQDEWLHAEESVDELDDGKVGIYELKEVKKRRTETHLKD